MNNKLREQNQILNQIPDIIKNGEAPESILGSIALNAPFWFVAAGKASLKTALHLEKEHGDLLIEGLIISDRDFSLSEKIQSFKGAHPIPDPFTIAASYEILDFAHKIPEGENLLISISGGASSMFTIPPFGIEIEEIQELYRLLLGSGLTIHKMNIVRKHVCDIKGGMLANELYHLDLISLIDSDVPGDDLSIIGSGPTVCDPSTFEDAFQILSGAGIWDEVPITIQEHIVCGMEGFIPENPKPDKDSHPNHRIELVTKSNGIKHRLKNHLSELGYNVWVDEESYDGNVREVSKHICSKAISVLSGNDEIKKPTALIFNGESTVKIIGKGKGGRNQELALMAALSIEGQHAISMLSMDTDGIDGPTDVSGAIINSSTTLKARKQKLEPERLLKENNSYEFHQKVGTHIKVGPTGINAMDLQVVLID